MKAFPNISVIKSTDLLKEFRVPIKLPVSEQPLHLKDFPMISPTILILSRVQHKNIEPNTYAYKGPCIQQWNSQTSSLVQVVQMIHQEFIGNPPLPVAQSNVQVVPQKQDYQGETLNLVKPQLNEFRSSLKNYPQELIENKEMLEQMYMCVSDVKPIKDAIQKQMEEVMKLGESNLAHKKEIEELAMQYENKFAEYSSLKIQFDQIKQREKQVLNNMSKDKVIQVLNQKVNLAENESKKIEKEFTKNGGNKKQFLDNYLKQRMDFHKYNILKFQKMQDQKKLIDMLEECKHYDKDNRYMAANDLCAEMLKQSNQLDEAMEKRICSAFMTHLDDTSLDVQGNAVKCIQKIAPKIKEKNLIMIVEKMAERVVEGEKETRDIYSLAIRSIINEGNDQFASAMIKSVYPRLIKGLMGAPEIREECLEIFAEIFKSFGGLLLRNPSLVNKDELMKVIPEQLSLQKQQLRKKATNCMGFLAVILNKNQLQSITTLLIKKIKESKGKTDSLTLIQCFGQMARTVGNKLAQFLNDIFPILFKFGEVLSKDSSVDIDNEIAEACISTFESLLKKCPKEMSPYVQQILGLTERLLEYDPNYTYNDQEDQEMDGDDGEGGWGSEFEEDAGGQEDDDDTSWKVRRSSIRVIDVIISSRPELMKTLYSRYTKKLVDRFKERDDNVKCNILETFQTLLKSTIIQESHQSIDLELSHQSSLVRQRSNVDELGEFLPQIVDQLLKQLKSKNVKVRATTMNTLASLAHSLHERLEPFFVKMIPDFEKNINETTSYDLILDTLVVMRRLFRSKISQKVQGNQLQQHYKKVLELLTKVMNHEYSKVVSEGLRVIGSYVNILKGPDHSNIAPQFADIVPDLFGLVKNKLQKTDIDQEVKQCSIIAMASIITVCNSKLNQQQIGEVVSIFSDRLQNELTRDASLKAITKIANNSDASDRSLIPLSNLPALLPRIFDLLHKTQRSLHLNSLECLLAMISRYNSQFTNQSPQILNEMAKFISDADLQAASLALKISTLLVVLVPQSNESQNVIQRATVLAYSQLIQGHCLDELLIFFQTASKVNAIKEQIVNELMNYVSVNSKAQMCIAAIARQSALGQKYFESFKQRLTQDPQSQIKGVLCLGEFGKYQDLSKSGNVIESVSALFKVHNEEVKTAASISLGNLSIGNPDFFLPKVFDLVDKSNPQEKYLFLNTIREIIIHNPKCLAPFIHKLLPLLVDHSKNEDEQIRNIVAESIGRLFVYYSQDMYDDIEKCFKSNNNFIRSTIVKSFKFAGHRDTDFALLEISASQIVNLVMDQDLNVKRHALESLNAIVHNNRESVRSELEKIEKLAIQETVIRPELIQEVDLGPFKHKVDEGIVIRKAAYALIDSLIDKTPEKLNVNIIVETVIKGLDDSAEECMILCLHIIGKTVQWTPAVIVSNLDSLVEAFEKQFDKYMKQNQNVQSSERAQNILRGILRVVVLLVKAPDVENNARFQDFFKRVMENPMSKDMYEKISATTNQAVFEHF